MLPQPSATDPVTRYWPTGYAVGVIGNIIRTALIIAPAAAAVFYNRGIPFERWEAKAFWIVWLLVLAFWVSDKFEYIDIGQGYFRRVGFFTFSDTKVPLSSIIGASIRPGWLGIPRVAVEWPGGRVEFAPVHFDPRLRFSRWTPYGIKQVVQRLRQERVPVDEDVLVELGLETPSLESVE